MSPAEELRAAADAVRPFTWVRGWAVVDGMPTADEVAERYPISGAALADLLDKWAWLANVDVSLLHRVGESEALAVARIVNQTQSSS